MTTIVGLDPSLTSTGIAVHRDANDIRTHRIRSTGKKDATWDDRALRLAWIVAQTIDVIPNDATVIMEAPSYGSVGGAQHDRSGLWWSLFRTLTDHGCTIIPVTPSQRMKYAVGKGGGKGCDKDNILAAAITRYPDLGITGNDIADAVIFMAIGCRLTGNPLEASLPKTHLDALAKISLPERTAA